MGIAGNGTAGTRFANPAGNILQLEGIPRLLNGLLGDIHHPLH